MKKTCLGIALLCLAPIAAFAQQDYPAAEVFGGYSFFRANPDALNLHGWNASVTGNISHWLGVEGDFSGHYGSPRVFGIGVPYVDVGSHTFMAGPRLCHRAGSVPPFAHFMLGAARASTGAFGVTISDTALATVVGAGLDIHINDAFAVRAFQADYLMTRFKTRPQIFFSGFEERQNNFRFSAGFVIKLGKR